MCFLMITMNVDDKNNNSKINNDECMHNDHNNNNNNNNNHNNNNNNINRQKILLGPRGFRGFKWNFSHTWRSCAWVYFSVTNWLRKGNNGTPGYRGRPPKRFR